MKFLHIADCHVGNRQYKMEERERDFESSFCAAMVDGRSQNVDAIIIAGDLFDNPKPTANNVLAVKTAVELAKYGGVQVLGVEGNHDQVYDNQWLRVCGIHALDCTSEHPEERYAKVKDCIVSGLPYTRPNELDAALDEGVEFCRTNNIKFDVFVMHVGLAEMGDSYAADTTVQAILPKLKAMGVRYVAMGHIHVPSEQLHDGIWFVQPGSTEVCAIDEAKDKLAEVVTIERDKELELTRLPLRTRPFVMKMAETDAEMDDLLNALDAGEFNGKFVDVYVSSKVRDGVKRLEAFKKAGVMYKYHDYGSSVSAEKKVIDRKKTFSSLEEIVDEDYAEGTHENTIIKTLMSIPPENAVPYAQKYMESGITETEETK